MICSMLCAKNILPNPIPFEIQYIATTENINGNDALSTLNCQPIDNIKVVKTRGPPK